MSHRSDRAIRPRRWWHSFWLWASVVLSVIAFLLIARSAAAQTERATQIIEQALAAEPNTRRGAALYRDHCASCHGRRAHGGSDPVTPSLAAQLPLYLIKQLTDFAEGDRAAPDMHRVVALKRLSTAQSLADVSRYLSGLPANSRPEVGDGANLSEGKRYYEGLCAFCHGAQGEGNAEHATPALQRQHYSYLLMQTRRLAVGHRYSVPIEVIQVLEVVPYDTMRAIADHVSRLPQASTGKREAL
jgi:cytochrome c553